MNQENPLAGVLNNQVFELRVARLLIIEWLSLGDEKTGSSLARRMRDLGASVEHVQCSSKKEVVLALRSAARNSSAKNIPIVHIEAHGDEGHEEPSRGFVGPDGSGGAALLTWEELGRELRAINMATRFNLIVVGAACYGEGLLLSIEPGKPVPFIVAVGYRGKVLAASLRDALIEFYRNLLVHKRPFSTAIEAANREHREGDTEIRDTSVAQLVLEAFCDARRRAKVLHYLPVAVRAAIERSVVERGWGLHFAFDEIPENEARFGIDVDRLIRVADSRPAWSE